MTNIHCKSCEGVLIVVTPDCEWCGKHSWILKNDNWVHSYKNPFSEVLAEMFKEVYADKLTDLISNGTSLFDRIKKK